MEWFRNGQVKTSKGLNNPVGGFCFLNRYRSPFYDQASFIPKINAHHKTLLPITPILRTPR